MRWDGEAHMTVSLGGVALLVVLILLACEPVWALSERARVTAERRIPLDNSELPEPSVAGLGGA